MVIHSHIFVFYMLGSKQFKCRRIRSTVTIINENNKGIAEKGTSIPSNSALLLETSGGRVS